MKRRYRAALWALALSRAAWAQTPIDDREIARLAQGVVDGRLTLSAMLLTEGDGAPDPADGNASNTTLGYGELRGVLNGRGIAGGIDFKADFRLRLTGDFRRVDAIAGHSLAQVTARGYSGGREYDLREAWIGWRGASLEAALGRLVVPEADALTVDGARLGWRFSPAWRASLFGGLYPNPFARSLPDDYVSSSALAGAIGAEADYLTPRAWGSLALVATLFGAPDDGGTIDPSAPAAPAGRTEAARVYLATAHYFRATSWLDLHGDLVLDVAGPAGAQLTRANLGARAHSSRLVLSAGYAHLSSLAVEMYLAALLRDRRNYLPGTIENNLVIERTARDEGRLRVEARPFAHLWIYGEGRLRRRALVEPGADPHFSGVAPLGAWDVTLGARDAGDLLGLRLQLSLSEITDFRAETRLLSFDAGRDFAGDLLGLDLSFLWENTLDAGAGAACVAPPSSLAPGCDGTRSGEVVEAGLTAALRPTRRWFLFADYRLIVDATDRARAIVTHVAFARLDLRF